MLACYNILTYKSSAYYKSFVLCQNKVFLTIEGIIMNTKLLGGILLIVGTSLGAGMLGLPVAAASLGFSGAFFLLVFFWALMLAGAFLTLEVNLLLPVNTNIISMAKKTVGVPGQMFTWVTYLLLLYSLLCAYIAGGGGLLSHVLKFMGVVLSPSTSVVVFTSVFGLIVYAGIGVVDKTNRIFITLKFATLFAVVGLLMPNISFEKLVGGQFNQLTSITAITVTCTSFGWAVLIPSLRTYFSNDIKMLKKAIWIGSLLPLIFYIVWDAIIMGIVSDSNLQAILSTQDSTGRLVEILSILANKPITTVFINAFTSISILTSFLGVALCLTDFIADGLNMEKKGGKNVLIHLLTFVPAAVVSVTIPGLFIKALEFAGLYCIILLILIPAWMAWCGRYRTKHISKHTVSGGKPFLGLVILVSLLLAMYILSNLWWR